MEYKIGVTGTRKGMTEYQKLQLHDILTTFRGKYFPLQFHEGDCVGADAESTKIAKKLGYIIYSHPPLKEDLRAWTEYDFEYSKKSYFARNRQIVDYTDILIVIPKETTKQNIGGTWYTHDYALSKNKPVLIIWPE